MFCYFLADLLRSQGAEEFSSSESIKNVLPLKRICPQESSKTEGGGGLKPKKTSVGGIWIFSETIHLHLGVISHLRITINRDYYFTFLQRTS